MPTKLLTTRRLLTIIFLLSLFQKGVAQNNKEEDLYNWFDNSLGRENLVLNNGTQHLNYDRTVNKEHRYYEANQFFEGQVNYAGQDYNSTYLKYDISKDVLVYKPFKESGNTGLNLIQENVTSFTLNGKKFVNLSLNKAFPTDFTPGYYEENLIGKQYVFYIKHQKESKEIIKGESIFLRYNSKNEFVLSQKNVFTKIKSKKDILKLFPDYKDKINDFYSLNNLLERENKKQFMENLMNYINNLLPSERN